MDEKEKEFQEWLAELIDDFTDWDVESYEEAGMLTRNAGLVITDDEGISYAVTIVRY